MILAQFKMGGGDTTFPRFLQGFDMVFFKGNTKLWDPGNEKGTGIKLFCWVYTDTCKQAGII